MGRSMHRLLKGLILFLIEAAAAAVLVAGILIFTNGMYLWGLPGLNDIQSVNISYPAVTDDAKEITDREDIESVLKLMSFLKYDLLEKADSQEESPAITITWFLKDGTAKMLSANDTTVWWNNKVHVIKHKEMFINLTEVIFFLNDLPSK